MGKKCPPGVICIENMTLIIIILVIAILMYFGFFSITSYVYNRSNKNSSSNSSNSSRTYSNVDYTLSVGENRVNNQNKTGLYPRPGYSFSNIENDVLLNPYQAPLRDNRLFPNINSFPNKIPINVPTQSYDTNYRQIGILTRIGGNKETIIPLMGRPLITNRDNWNFYTLSENNNMLKLPISHDGRKCMSQNGCKDLYTGDTVSVDGYNDSFKVTTYENNSPQYIPYL